MKLQLFIVTMTLMSATAARAEGKEALQVNFNQLIDEGQHDDAGLNKDLSGHYKEAKDPAAEEEAAQNAAEAKDDSQRVHDFVTFEVIQMKKDNVAAEEKPVVKRTYNSVEEPRVATLPEVELIPVKSR